MKLFRGKEILETLEEIVAPEHCMLLVYDGLKQMKRSAKAGRPYFAPLEHTLDCWSRLINAARSAQVPVVYARHTFAVEPVSGPYLRYVAKQYRGAIEALPFVPFDEDNRDIWDNEIMDELAPRPDEIVFRKYFNNAFTGTPMLSLLKGNNVKTLIITGLQTESGVEMNARVAVLEGYYAVVVKDCINSKHQDLHDASLKYLDALCDVTTHDRIIDVWKKGGTR